MCVSLKKLQVYTVGINDLTIQSPVGYRGHSNTTLEQRAVGEEQQGGHKPSVRLGSRKQAGFKRFLDKKPLEVCSYSFLYIKT